MKKAISLIVSVVLAFGLLAGCGANAADTSLPGNSAAAGGEKVKVVTTIFPQYDFVREIAGDNVELTMLLPPGAESHSFEPSPKDIITIQECDIFIYVGGDSDVWIADILDSMDTSSMTILSLMDMVEVKEEEIVEGMEHDHDHGHEHAEIDPDNVKDRELTDFAGDWATIETALAAGALDEYITHQAEENEVSFDEQKSTYESAWKTDYPTLRVDGDKITFVSDSGEVSATYAYANYELIEGDHGLSVWYGYTKESGDDAAPQNLVFNDHGDGNVHEEEEHDEHDESDAHDEHDSDEHHEHATAHTHVRYGSETVAELAAITDWTPFYFDAAASHEEVAQALGGHGHSDEEEEEGHEHEEGELDEHVWTSPKNAKLIVQAISNTLQQKDAANADIYAQNTTAYLAKLDELDAAFEEAVAAGSRNTIVFGDRFPFRYFADDYGLEYFAAFTGCSTETEASAATIAFLIDKVKDEHIPVVFYIEMSNEKIADTLCEDTGAEKRLMHSCHNVSKQEMEAGASYLSLMTQNIEVLREALA